MKMQSGIVAPRDGKVAEVFVSRGNTVESNQMLLRYE